MEKYFGEQVNLTVLGAYQRNSELSQDRVYDSRLGGLLSEQDLRYAMPTEFSTDSSYRGVFKYAANRSDLWEKVDLVPLFNYFESAIATVCKHRKISWMEAWPETEHSSSTGYPVNQRYRDKKAWFEHGAKYINSSYTDDGRLVREPNPLNMEEYREFVAASTYDDVVCLWNVFSKNEALTLEKIADSRLRQINGGDCRFIALQTEYHKQTCDKYYENWRYHHSRAGMPIQYGGWDWLARTHISRGEWSYIIDISQQDSTMPAAVMDLIFAIDQASGLADEPSRHIARVLHENVKRSCMVMPDGVAVSKAAGNPSGQFKTLRDATMAGDIYMMFAWLKLSKRNLADFDKEFFFSCCGDDGWKTGQLCDPKHTPTWWTPQAIVKLWADYGIKAEVERVRTREATFLSHRTIRVRGMYVPYPTNHHKAVVNILNPPKKHINNYPLLLGRILAQRNRFFADCAEKTVSYWRVFDRLADVYRPLADEQRGIYPADYKAAKSLDLVASSVASLYMPQLESSASRKKCTAALKHIYRDG